MIFSLADVEIGQQALEERLKTVFGVVGAKTLNGGAFSDANLTFSLTPTDDGRVRAVVTPKKDADGNAPSTFFMKVKMK
jgi:hypothetical protein